MSALPLAPGIAGMLGVPRPDGRGKRRLLAGRRDVTRIGKRNATPAFRALVSKRVVEAACAQCRADGRNLTCCDEAIDVIARRFNMRRPLVQQIAYCGTVEAKIRDRWGVERDLWTGEYDFSRFDDAPERAELEDWERAMERTAPLRELVALVRDMPTAKSAEDAAALFERMDQPTRDRVSFAVYQYLTAVDLANSVRELLAEASGWATRAYEERVADEPLIASLEVI